MAKKILVANPSVEHAISHCEALEAGDILFFQDIPFPFPQEEIDFLLQQRQGSSRARKNIAYKPQGDLLTNYDARDPVSAERLKTVLRTYSSKVVDFLSRFLSPYSALWKIDYASFRPFQEKGRALRTRARNDLLHVDAFPTRPLHGERILRFFTNINPTESRRWMTSEPFAALATRFGGKEVPFPRGVTHAWSDRLRYKFQSWLQRVGVPLRSPYDRFMLELHNFLKENREFQESCPKDHWDFPPRSCWAVFTDQVSHAALSGQYALEQTIIVPRQALLRPECAPVSILERLSERNMVLPH